ncbi:MAG TPA: ATP-grasp domain-containing protein [Pilimelia sp.]|nr:ATP-grasp domain-containing protein [Pilimelia sp.]
MTLGVADNPYARNAPTAVRAAAEELGVPVRVIDLPSLALHLATAGAATATDRHGAVRVDSLAPYLLFGYPAATHAFRVVTRTAFCQNPVDAVLTADDKAATAQRLALAGVPQVPTHVCALDRDQLRGAAAGIGYPVVVKRTHGAQGRWVRRAHDDATLDGAYDELAAEGPGALVVQPLVGPAEGTSVRAVVTGGRIIGAAQRTADAGEWRSNIAGGASQVPVTLTDAERDAVLGAVRALGLGHAGVDLLRSGPDSFVLEVNSCPDFTSMLPYFAEDLRRAVVTASLCPPA